MVSFSSLERVRKLNCPLWVLLVEFRVFRGTPSLSLTLFRSRIKWRYSRLRRPQLNFSGGTQSIRTPSPSTGGTQSIRAPSPSTGGTQSIRAPSPTSSGSGCTFRHVPIQDNDTSGDCSVPIQAVVSRRNPTRTCPLGVRGSYAQNFVPSPRGWRKLCPFFAMTHTGSLFAFRSTTQISLLS